MSIFYCEYHGKLEDADWVNCQEHPNGGMVCDEGLDIIEEEREEAAMPNNHVFTIKQQAFIDKCMAEDRGEGI